MSQHNVAVGMTLYIIDRNISEYERQGFGTNTAEVAALLTVRNRIARLFAQPTKTLKDFK